MLPPPLPLKQGLLTAQNLQHRIWQYGNRYGRYKTTEEIESEENPTEFWIEGSTRRANYKRSEGDVQRHLSDLQSKRKEGKLAEYDPYWDKELLSDLTKAGGTIRNIVTLDLGSLCYCDESDFEGIARAHLFARNILKVLSDAANEVARSGNKDPLEGGRFICEDDHYGNEDLKYLRMSYLSDGTEGWTNGGRIMQRNSNEGVGWSYLEGGNGDYIFITFNPKDPIRQLLANLLYSADELKDSSSWRTGKLVKPRAIIYRDPKKEGIDKRDPTDYRVKNWFNMYYEQVHKFDEGTENKIWGGDIYLYTLKSRVKSNAPSA